MDHIVVREIDDAVCNAKEEIQPSQAYYERRNGVGYIGDDDAGVEKDWYLKQIHENSVWQSNVGWDVGGLPTLKVIGPNAVRKKCAKPANWYLKQDEKRPEH